MSQRNRQLRVRAWSDGPPRAEDFELAETGVPVPGDAQVLIRNRWLSVDPYYRHALGPRFVGTPLRRPGDVMMAVSLGEVVASRDPRIAVGRHVTTLLGDCQDFAAVDGRDVRLLPDDPFGEGKLPLSTALGVAGMPGLTAWAALTAHAAPQPGETFVVSSASGCVGATAGQLARLMGLRAVGIAGTAAKCAWVTDVARFDTCVSHRGPDLAATLAAACPDGIDIDMEHVGGRVLDAILPLMTPRGRVVLSGLIDQYNAAVAPSGPNWGVIVQKQLTVTGLRVFDHVAAMPRFERLVAARIADDSLVYREDIHDGLAAMPAALAGVLSGANFGKTLIGLEV